MFKIIFSHVEMYFGVSLYLPFFFFFRLKHLKVYATNERKR